MFVDNLHQMLRVSLIGLQPKLIKCSDKKAIKLRDFPGSCAATF